MRSLKALALAGMGLCVGGSGAAGQAFAGAKGGVVSSSIILTGPGADTDRSFLRRRTGSAAGLFLSANRGVIGLQLEAFYTEKGAKVEGEFAGSPFAGTYSSAYLEVPILVRVGASTRSFRPYLYAGPAAAIELKCNGELTLGGQTGAGSCDEAESQFNESRRKLDFTALAGAGIQVPVGRLAILLEGRYSRGLRDINRTGEQSARNEAWVFLSGVTVPLSAK